MTPKSLPWTGSVKYLEELVGKQGPKPGLWAQYCQGLSTVFAGDPSASAPAEPETDWKARTLVAEAEMERLRTGLRELIGL